MCGIVGYITKYGNGFSSAEASAFQDMLYVDTMRGWDSTGVFGVDNKGNVELHKDALHGPDFIQTKEFKDFKQAGVRAGQLMVGHNRAATRGSVTDKNAHPFCVDDKIILVQNGTYRGDHKHLKNVEVDTEAITHILSEVDDIQDALQRINAAYALVWYNTKTKCLYMIRNNERPLHLAKTKTGAFMFASEQESILWAASRNNISLAEAPWLLMANHLVTVQLEKDGTWEMTGEDIKAEYNGSKYSPYNAASPYFQPPPPARNYNNHAAWEGWEGDSIGEWDNNVGQFRRFRPNYQPHNSRHVDRESLSSDPRMDNKITMNAIIAMQSMAKYVHCEPDDAESLQKYVVDKTAAGTEKGGVAVELLDYHCANDHKDCQLWYVYGQIFDVDWPEDKPAPLVYWMLSGVSEDHVLNYTSHGWYKVKPGTPTLRFTTDNANHRKVAVIAFSTDVVPIHTETHEAVH